MTEDQIKHMTDRFLQFPFPKTMNPDGGISYSAIPNHQPVGTNLLSAVEAETMVRFMIEGMPEPAVRHVYRDAVTGEFVSEEYAEANPATTIRQTVVD